MYIGSFLLLTGNLGTNKKEQVLEYILGPELVVANLDCVGYFCILVKFGVSLSR